MTVNLRHTLKINQTKCVDMSIMQLGNEQTMKILQRNLHVLTLH